jgi:O-antigen ligase
MPQEKGNTLSRICAAVLFAVAGFATLTISLSNPLLVWCAEGAVLLLAAILSLRNVRSSILFVPSALIALWGFAQLALGATVYRYATLDSALRFAAFFGTAWIAVKISPAQREWDRWLGIACWFSVAVSIVSVLAYQTSPQKILWLLPGTYPDNWGPFASRNNFAQLLELTFPIGVHWFLKGDKEERWFRALAPAILFAAGIASASRAGALLLATEALVLTVLIKKQTIVWVASATVGLVLLMGAGAIKGRFQESDPFSVRREVFASATRMIEVRPWTGYGLGTFSQVYPEFATFDPGARIERAHNDWLEWAAEGGIPFAALWVVLGILVARPAVRSIWGLGVLATLAHALVDYPFARFGIGIWFFALCGFLQSAECVDNS